MSKKERQLQKLHSIILKRDEEKSKLHVLVTVEVRVKMGKTHSCITQLRNYKYTIDTKLKTSIDVNLAVKNCIKESYNRYREMYIKDVQLDGEKFKTMAQVAKRLKKWYNSEIINENSDTDDLPNLQEINTTEDLMELLAEKFHKVLSYDWGKVYTSRDLEGDNLNGGIFIHLKYSKVLENALKYPDYSNFHRRKTVFEKKQHNETVIPTHYVNLTEREIKETMVEFTMRYNLKTYYKSKRKS